jgi:hypothetical protein
VSHDEDEWKWKLEDNDVFSVSSMYKVLEVLLILEDGLNAEGQKVFSYILKSTTPSKLVAFSW